MAAPAPRLTHAQLAELKETFRLFDKNHDGSISLLELKAVMESMKLRPTSEELQQMMEEADRNGNGSIDFNEFAVMMAPTLRPNDVSDELREAFAVFDKDGSGKISARELKQAMATLGDRLSDDEVKEIIKEVDWDGDGMVSYEEFVAMMSGGKNPDRQASVRGKKEKPKKEKPEKEKKQEKEQGQKEHKRRHFWQHK
ncbi:calmodulin 5 [Jimgerdemannia flammicorona]|uniref:Calmodulin 5 n=2 Tax=Jimgerdemannia flammicorona TaxID=994334 RepID=A0A433D6A7_9FUNG|nr:calmodulin 5 [Jimgerdemannia flammicorona]RUS32888.1 calmodulin 5 [Jimgerdemannia flammicorona]